jgi:hypothetical protein
MSADTAKKKYRTIIDREKLMANPEGCPACGQKFNMGEPAVYACGKWGQEPKLVHESDAEFDSNIHMYVERDFYEAQRST